jgi:hypothetical protein
MNTLPAEIKQLKVQKLRKAHAHYICLMKHEEGNCTTMELDVAEREWLEAKKALQDAIVTYHRTLLATV